MNDFTDRPFPNIVVKDLLDAEKIKFLLQADCSYSWALRFPHNFGLHRSLDGLSAKST